MESWRAPSFCYRVRLYGKTASRFSGRILLMGKKKAQGEGVAPAPVFRISGNYRSSLKISYGFRPLPLR